MTGRTEGRREEKVDGVTCQIQRSCLMESSCGQEHDCSSHSASVSSSVKYPKLMAHAPCGCVCAEYVTVCGCLCVCEECIWLCVCKVCVTV